MTKQLRDGLTRQRVNFDEDYNAWNKLVTWISLVNWISKALLLMSEH